MSHLSMAAAKSPTTHQSTSTPAEHVISYAYPSSELAHRLGRSSSGCFVLEVARQVSPAATYAEARAVTDKLGTTPGRWSIDHPANASFNRRPASQAPRSVSDDDLCARCQQCDFRPGEMSSCAAQWPCLPDEDGYVQQCDEFAEQH